jgi:Mce-associated membrane protein
MDIQREADRHRLHRTLVLVSAALAAVAAVGAAFFGWSWWSTANDASLQFARDRDDVLRYGQQDIVNFNTLDYHNVDAGLNRWLDSSTGQLHDDIVQGRDDSKQRIQDAKTATTAKVVDAAVTQLDDRAGTATLIALVDTVVTPEGGQAVTKRNEFQAAMTRTPAGWKISALGPVPVGSSGS